MNFGSWVILGVVILICLLAVRSIISDHKKGKTSCGSCHACSAGGGTGPQRNCAAVDQMVANMEYSAGLKANGKPSKK